MLSRTKKLTLLVGAIIVSITSYNCTKKSEGLNLLLALPLLMNTSAVVPSTSVSVTGPVNLPGAVEGTAPYFQSLTFTRENLKDDSIYPNKYSFSNVVLTDKSGNTLETASFRGILLRDLLITNAKFRPEDKGKDGRATVIKIRGAGGDASVFSFNEIIKTSVGDGIVIAYEKNTANLPDTDGHMALLSINDTKTGYRYTKQLSGIEVENLWVTQTTGAATTDIAFSGEVTTPVTVNAASFAASTKTSFTDVGPSFNSSYYRAEGVLLIDAIVEKTGGLRYPDEKNRCYLLIETADKYRSVFSCGELAFTVSGLGQPSHSNPAKHRGVILVTGNSEKTTQGTNRTDCALLPDIDSCNPISSAAWSSNSGDNMKVVPSEDGRKWKWPEAVSDSVNLGGRSVSWITKIDVVYVN